MNKHADVLKILKIMGENHPFIEQTCLTLLVDEYTSVEVAKIQLSFLLKKQKEQPQPTDSVLNRNPQPESNYSPESEKQTTLPKLSQSEPWHFTIPFVTEHRSKITEQQPNVDEFNHVKPYEYIKSENLHRSADLALAYDWKLLWYELFLYLGLHCLNSQLDDKKLSQQFAQRQAIIHLPYKKPRRTDKETWLIIDQTQAHFPFYGDFKHFTKQLYRYLGQGTISNVIEVVDFTQPIHWRIRYESGETSEYHTDILPLPTNKQQLILLCDFDNFSTAKWQNWLKQATELSSCLLKLTIVPQRDAIYFGRIGELKLAKKAKVKNELAITPNQLAKQNLLAILSITPARFTLAMIRELRQEATGGSLALEAQLFNYVDFIWVRFSGNGYWAQPSSKFREAFKELPNKLQQQAIAIICKHLPKGAPSLTHEVFLFLSTLLNETQCVPYQKQINDALQFAQEVAAKIRSNQNEPLKNRTYLNYIHDMASRMGDYADSLAPLAKQLVTLVNFQAKQLNPNLPETAGIDAQEYFELHSQEHQMQRGSLLQQGNGFITTVDENQFGRQLIELNDISTVLFTQKESRAHNNIKPNNQFTPNKKTKQISGQSALDKFAIELLNSDKLYWASGLALNGEGIDAKAEGFTLSWLKTSNLEHPEKNDVENLLAQSAIVTIDDNAPSWLKKYQPQLDNFGIYVIIPIQEFELKLRYIPAGSFIMGSPEDEQGHKLDEKQHPVSLTESFWLSETTVSRGFWEALMTDKNSRIDNILELSHPIANTGQKETLNFYNKLYDEYELVALPPSEAQWEYACRAGTKTSFNNGLNSLTTDEANYYAVDHVTDITPSICNTHEFSPNNWGLYQMHGNVWELCLDSYQKDISSWNQNPVSDTIFNSRFNQFVDTVARGGNFVSNVNGCRSAARKQTNFSFLDNGSRRNAYYGLRICVANENLKEHKSNNNSYIDKALVAFKYKIKVNPFEILSREYKPYDEAQESEKKRFIKVDNLDIAEHNSTKRWQLRPPSQFPNAWAKSYGYDQFGLWQTLALANIEIRFRYITPGHYITGSVKADDRRDLDEKQHQDTLGQGFWLAETTISEKQWNTLIAIFDNQHQVASAPQSRDIPMTNIDWLSAIQFCQLLKQQYPSLNITLPTELQWEYACKANNSAVYGVINHDEAIDEYANFNNQDQTANLIDVVDKKPNVWGIKQMLGNVWEWCLDGYDNQTINLVGKQQQFGVLRGGSWLDKPENGRSSFRYYAPKQTKANNIGLRLCININQSTGSDYLASLALELDMQQQKALRQNQQILNNQTFTYANYNDVRKAADKGQKQLSVKSQSGQEHIFDVQELIDSIPVMQVETNDSLAAQSNESVFNFQTTNIELQGDLNDLATELFEANHQEEAKQFQSIAATLAKVEKYDTPAEIKKSSLGKQVPSLLGEMGAKDSRLHKLLQGMKNGISIAQDLAAKYNSIAQWAALPQVPSIFLKDDILQLDDKAKQKNKKGNN